MIVMGHVTDPFGILGWIKITPYTEHIDGLLDYPTWWLGNENETWREIDVVSGKIINEKTLKAKLKGCDDRTQASQFKGMQIAIPRDQLPELPQNGKFGYYWSDLIGAEVVNLHNDRIGTVIGFFETGANDVIRVQSPDQNKSETLIPFVEQIIVTVDLKSSRIIVDWGLNY